MELSWLMRFRIAASLATGVVLIGILAWPIVRPPDPLGAMSLVTGNINAGGAMVLALAAVVAGVVGYFVSWPWGREIGIVAAPAGLAVWAVRCGSMADIMQQNPTVEQREALFSALRWEPLFWFALVAAGFAGVLLAEKIRSAVRPGVPGENPKSRPKSYLAPVITVVGSVLIAQICISIFARDVAFFDRQMGSIVMGQPAVGQIAFAVCLAFGIAAFVFKKFLNASYVWPAIASSLVTAFSVISYVKKGALQGLVQNWPAVFFSNAVLSVLPVQMVAFGTLGAVAGYWLAVRYGGWWRKHA